MGAPLRAVRILGETILVLAIGVGVGAAAVWLFAPPPTPENSSPPPEVFLFVDAFFFWLVAFVLGKLVYRRLQRRNARPS